MNGTHARDPVLSDSGSGSCPHFHWYSVPRFCSCALGCSCHRSLLKSYLYRVPFLSSIAFKSLDFYARALTPSLQRRWRNLYVGLAPQFSRYLLKCGYRERRVFGNGNFAVSNLNAFEPGFRANAAAPQTIPCDPITRFWVKPADVSPHLNYEFRVYCCFQQSILFLCLCNRTVTTGRSGRGRPRRERARKNNAA